MPSELKMVSPWKDERTGLTYPAAYFDGVRDWPVIVAVSRFGPKRRGKQCKAQLAYVAVNRLVRESIDPDAEHSWLSFHDEPAFYTTGLADELPAPLSAAEVLVKWNEYMRGPVND